MNWFKAITKKVSNCTDSRDETPESNPAETPQEYFKRNIKEIAPTHWRINWHGTLIEFPPVSWQRARSFGETFYTMIGRVKPSVFEFLGKLCHNPCVEYLEVSSLWRPPIGGSSPHNFGNGIDFGTIRVRKGNNIFLYRPTLGDPAPRGITKFRRLCWDTGMVWQYIGPWNLRGNNISRSWIANTGANNLQRTHMDHIHLTIAV